MVSWPVGRLQWRRRQSWGARRIRRSVGLLPGRVEHSGLRGGADGAARTPEWIARLRPGVILLSIGADDKRSLPDPESLAEVQGYSLLRTDQNGWIELSTDGEQMWVEAVQ